MRRGQSNDVRAGRDDRRIPRCPPAWYGWHGRGLRSRASGAWRALRAQGVHALGVTFYRLLTGIWYEPGPVADGFLAEFGEEWSRALRQLLSDDPAARLPIPSVETGGVPAKKRRRIVAICAAVAALVITGVFLCLVGRDHRARRAAGSRVPRDRGHASRVPPPGTALPEYTFNQFFPLHKED